MGLLAGVAQLVRAPDCGSGSRGFKSHHSPQPVFTRRWLGLRVVLVLFTLVASGFVDGGLGVALGDAYRDGLAAYRGQDFVAAHEAWMRVSERPEASHALGLLYERGLGVDQDLRRAVEWYRKAAQSGHAAAQFNLGRLYALGQGVVRDLTQAARWWLRAADQGNPHALHNLGLMFYAGEGVRQDFDDAAVWLRRAAAHNFPDSEYLLGEMIRLGRVKARENEDPIDLLLRAAQHGSEKAQVLLRALDKAGELKPGRLEEAQRNWPFVPQVQISSGEPGGTRADSAPQQQGEGHTSDANAPRFAVAEPQRAKPAQRGDANGETGPLAWRAWLASFSSASAALREWRHLREELADLIGKMEPDFRTVRVAVGDYVSHRLRVGPMETRESVDVFCRQVRMRRKDAFCVPVSD